MSEYVITALFMASVKLPLIIIHTYKLFLGNSTMQIWPSSVACAIAQRSFSLASQFFLLKLFHILHACFCINSPHNSRSRTKKMLSEDSFSAATCLSSQITFVTGIKVNSFLIKLD